MGGARCEASPGASRQLERSLEVDHVASTDHVVRSFGETTHGSVILNVAIDVVELHLRVGRPEQVERGGEVAADASQDVVVGKIEVRESGGYLQSTPAMSTASLATVNKEEVLKRFYASDDALRS